MTTIAACLKEMSEAFAAAGVDNPDLDARLLLQQATGLEMAGLLLNMKQILTVAQLELLERSKARRLKREPVSRILGKRGFWKSDFKVTPQTLDPRPDSEALIEAALTFAGAEVAGLAAGRLLDLGTGTGCLLLSLLIEWPKATGVGVDISPDAVATAEENAAAVGVGARAQFVATDWQNYRPADQVDVVLSNPPYIPDGDIAGLAPEVAAYDPVRALAGGADGLDCYRDIAGRLKTWLKPGGWAFLEIGHDQAAGVNSILAKAGVVVIQTVPDLAGSDRVIVARRS